MQINKSKYYSFTTTQADGVDYEVIVGWNTHKKTFYFEVLLDDQPMMQSNIETNAITSIMELEQTLFVVIPDDIRAKLFVDSGMINFHESFRKESLINEMVDYVNREDPPNKSEYLKQLEGLKAMGFIAEFTTPVTVPVSTSTAVAVVNSTHSYPSYSTYNSKTLEQKILELFD